MRDKEKRVHGPSHMDGNIIRPTITIDNIVVTRDGIFMDESLGK